MLWLPSGADLCLSPLLSPPFTVKESKSPRLVCCKSLRRFCCISSVWRGLVEENGAFRRCDFIEPDASREAYALKQRDCSIESRIGRNQGKSQRSRPYTPLCDTFSAGAFATCRSPLKSGRISSIVRLLQLPAPVLRYFPLLGLSRHTLPLQKTRRGPERFLTSSSTTLKVREIHRTDGSPLRSHDSSCSEEERGRHGLSLHPGGELL